MAVKTYDPNQGALTYGTNIITGFAEDTMLTISRNEDAWTLQIGVDGEGTRSKSNNKSGRVTFSLMQSSDSNKVMSGIAAIDEISGSQALPLQFKYKNELYIAETAWIVKFPDAEYARTATARVWVLESDILVMRLAGES